MAEKVKVDEIPGEDKVARFLQEHEITRDETKTSFVPSINAFYDTSLSVDWLSRTSIDDAYGRLGKSVAHVVFQVMDLRKIDERVEHDPTIQNPAHSLVIHPAGGKKRPMFYVLRFIQLAKESAFRPSAGTEVARTANVLDK